MKNKLFEEFLKTPEGQAWKETQESAFLPFCSEYLDGDDFPGYDSFDEDFDDMNDGSGAEILDFEDLIEDVVEELRLGNEPAEGGEILEDDAVFYAEDFDEEEDADEDSAFDFERNKTVINVLLYAKITGVFEDLGLSPYINEIHLDDCTALEFYVDINNQAGPLRCLFYINEDPEREEYIFVADPFPISELYRKNVMDSGLFDIYCQETLDLIAAVNPFAQKSLSVLAQDSGMKNVVYISKIRKLADDLKGSILEAVMNAVFTLKYFGPSIMALYDGKLVLKEDIVSSGMEYLNSSTTKDPVYPRDELMEYLKPTKVDPDYCPIEKLVHLYQQMHEED